MPWLKHAYPCGYFKDLGIGMDATKYFNCNLHSFVSVATYRIGMTLTGMTSPVNGLDHSPIYTSENPSFADKSNLVI